MRELKAIVLCAGEGTRLRPLTFSKPKHLLPVAGVPLLGHVLGALAEAGLRDVGLVVGHHPEAVQRYVGDGDQWGLQATYITQEKPLGLAHAVSLCREYLQDAPFVLYLGDNLLAHGIRSFVDRFRDDGMDASLLLREVDDPRRYGVAVLDAEGRVTRLVEKPQDPPSNLAIVGVYAFMPSIFQAIASIQPSARGELEITDAIQYLIEHGGKVGAEVFTGYWEDAGEPLSLLLANRQYLDAVRGEMHGSVQGRCVVGEQVSVGKGTRLVDSELRGPCLIGRNCVVRASVIGPYVALGDGCEVNGSAIEDSVIQSNCTIWQLPSGLQGSVLGEQVQIMGDGREGAPLHLILGDMAQIRMF
jgi:glucose-1-phosphate thymidylyltransferase